MVNYFAKSVEQLLIQQEQHKNPKMSMFVTAGNLHIP